jgi:hypothetical protein
MANAYLDPTSYKKQEEIKESIDESNNSLANLTVNSLHASRI